MKLWRLSYHEDDSPSGNLSLWRTSRREIDAAAKALRKEYSETCDHCGGTGKNDEGAACLACDNGIRYRASFFIYDEPKRVEVPSTAAALADWLTKYEP